MNPPPSEHHRLDDAELVDRARNGDQEACNHLLSRHYDRIYAICRRVTGNDADAADGCQEALMAIVRGLPRFDGRSTFKTWSYRVATNACLDEIRRRNRRPTPSEAVDQDVAERSLDGGRIEDRVVERDRIDSALEQLSEEFRLPIVLRDVGGLDYAEIATTLNVPPGTVRSRIARGRRQLSQILGNQNDPDQRHRTETDTRPPDLNQ